MPSYELVVLFDPYLQDEEYPTAIEKVKDLIARRGGEVTNVDIWGRRRMAYPIAKKIEAYYIVVSFEAPSSESALAEITRNLRLNENVLRVMLTRVPDLSKKVQKAAKNKKGEVVTGSAGDAGAAAQ